MTARWESSPQGLTLRADDDSDQRVIRLCQDPWGTITFREACDDYFFVTVTRQEARRLLQEALDWIGE